MKKIFTLSVFTILCTCSIFSADKILILGGYPVAIVANDVEWNCSTEKNGNYLMIIGKSNIASSFSFEFMHWSGPDSGQSGNDNLLLAAIKKFLQDESFRTNTIFNDLKSKEEGRSKGVRVFDGNFLNHETYGHFRIHLLNEGFHCYLFFMKVKGDFFDEATREVLYKKTTSLIRPTIS